MTIAEDGSDVLALAQTYGVGGFRTAADGGDLQDAGQGGDALAGRYGPGSLSDNPAKDVLMLARGFGLSGFQHLPPSDSVAWVPPDAQPSAVKSRSAVAAPPSDSAAKDVLRLARGFGLSGFQDLPQPALNG